MATTANTPEATDPPTGAGAPRSSRRAVPGPEKLTHDYDGELVVFIIGMRIRRWWRFDQWIPVFAAMPRMLAELSADPDSGMRGYRLVFDPRGPWLVQYWDSLEKIYSYAAAPESEHRPAWTAFNTRARSAPNAVGVWHETFPVAGAESMYVGTPPLGLAKAVGTRPVGPRSARARDRQARRDR
ncbi:DUF4188 domain-containing protein [Brevibacterium casei]|uniref:DUF4188 domain-containing protein n=1 Tax=Brevibacterium casei TaxID=33889 RepID=UPI001CE4D9E0|nr:DUF4188 domain-containing protein [Brevibacterium casei]MCT1765143.1 DUF4188 domain-containing protein [Brevibacterium casei]MCT2182549.1 DUF4188 domain-containing protein [Brevibacterium casei]MDH5147282.1 DUF4188 domain-containing protein [Brevibacterium casei]QZE26343.1 DUF4188 domain-containing protein [Brevibacterium casei]